jgi:hypothetical protein
VWLVCAAGCAGQQNYVALPPPAEPGPIAGTLLDSGGRPFPDQIVAIGAEKTTSDGDGRFSFPVVPGGYDLVIASPDGSTATVYQGLTRRDPIVTLAGGRTHEPAHSAVVVVTLAGNEGANERWDVDFASPRAIPVSGGRRPTPPAPGAPREPETIAVKWDGADTITGVVMAAATRRKQLEIQLALFARKDLTLRDGETANLTLVPAKVPVVKRPRPRVITPKEDPGFDPVYREDYHLPGVGGTVRGPGRAGKAYDIPDLRGFGLELCALAFQGNPYLRSRRVQCGLDPTKSLSIPLPSPPAFTAPALDTLASPGMRFAWSAVPNAVYLLTLAGGSQSSAHPNILIVTMQTTVGWPDLQAVGVGFPTPLATYTAVVAVRGPHSSVDELVGSKGRGGPTSRDHWGAESLDLGVRVWPPLGKEEAACRFHEAAWCDGGGFYRLSVINRKIQTHPEFAAAMNIHCVRDCEGARAYGKAHADYSVAHPGFDSHDPMPVEEPEPWPPPDMLEGRRGD